MKLTDILRAEHRVIETALGALEGMAGEAGSGAPVPAKDVGDFVRFCRSYTDGLHHVKEEEMLFPALIQAGLPRDTGPIGCMLDEHARARKLVRELDELAAGTAAGDPASLAAFARTAAAFAELLRAHIEKEDKVLFEMAEKALGPERNESLAAGLVLGQTKDRRARDAACAEALAERWCRSRRPPARSDIDAAAIALATGR